jgi:HSP20 family molecular chaperone IbpA
MSSLSVRRHPRSLFPEFSELFAGFPSLAGLRPVFDTHVMRLEDEVKDGRYVVRAEAPGIDPTNDIEITVRDGQLTIKVERVAAGGRRRRQHRGHLRQRHPHCLRGDLGAEAGRTACSGAVRRLKTGL